MNASELEGMVCALLNHFDMLPPNAYSLEQLRERMYEWPAVPASKELFKAALDLLEAEGMAARVTTGDKELWRRVKD